MPKQTLPKTVAAYLALPEKQKLEILAWGEKYSLTWYNNLLQCAGLDCKWRNCSKSEIRKRRDAIDYALTTPENHHLLVFMIVNFLSGKYDHGKNKPLGREWRDFSDVANNELLPSTSSSRISTSENVNHHEKTQSTLKTSSITENTPIYSLQQQLNHLLERANDFDKMTAQIRIALPMEDVKAIQICLSETAKEIEAFRTNVAIEAKRVNLDNLTWSTKDELDRKLTMLFDKIRSLESQETQLRTFIDGLAFLVDQLNVTDRISRCQSMWKEIQKDAVKELKDAAMVPSPRAIERTETLPRPWLEKMFGLTEEEREKAADKLKENQYCHLADLISIGKLAWLPPTAMTTEQVAKPELPIAKQEIPPPSSIVMDQGISSPPPKTRTGGNVELASTIPPIVNDIILSTDDLQPSASVATIVTPAPLSDACVLANSKGTPAIESTSPSTSIKPAETATVLLAEIALAEPMALLPSPDISQKKKVSSSIPPKSVLAKEDVLMGEDKRFLPIKGSIEEVVKQVVATTKDDRNAALASLVYVLLENGNYSLAYHLTQAIEECHELSAMKWLPQTWIIEALALTATDAEAPEDIVCRLQELFASYDVETIFKDGNGILNDIDRFLLLAISLRATFLASASGPDNILNVHSLHFEKTPAVAELVHHMYDFARYRLPLSKDSLFSILHATDWHSKKAEIQKRAERIWECAPKKTITYAHGTYVWQAWFRPGNIVYRLLNPIIKGEENLEPLKEALDDLKLSKLNKLIDQTYKEKKVKQALEGNSRRKLIESIDELKPIVNEWIALISSSPDEGNGTGHVRKHVENLVELVSQHADGALHELREIKKDSETPWMTIVACKIATEAVEWVVHLVKGKAVITSRLSEYNMDYAKGIDLLELPSVDLDDNWRPLSAPDQLIRQITTDLAETDIRRKAFQARCKKGDHWGSRWLISSLRVKGETEDNLQHLYKERETSMVYHKAALMELIDVTQKELSEALAKGYVNENDYATYSAKIETVRSQLDSASFNPLLRFDVVRMELQNIRYLLSNEEKNNIDMLRTRMKAQQQEMGKELSQRIDRILARGDVHLANDYLERWRNGDDLPNEISSSEAADELSRLYGRSSATDKSCFEMLEDLLSPADGMDKMIQFIEKGTDIAGVPISMMDTGSRQAYVSVLKMWKEVKKARTVSNVAQLQFVFSEIGFNQPALTIKRETGSASRMTLQTKSANLMNHTTYRMNTESIIFKPGDIAVYGSEADGSYQVICVFGPMTVEDLVSIGAGSGGGQIATIVLYFQLMGARMRQDLAQRMCQRTLKFIVVDDLIMAYLAGVVGSKLRSLLKSTLPFTSIVPYTQTASLIPSEMFFGRSREIDSLETTKGDGSSLVYGGRQIGKTVLLRHVKRRVHHPSEGRVACYVDLKQGGIGMARSLDDLWLMLVTELSNVCPEIFPENLPPVVKYDWFNKHVNAWLNDNKGRRILLLLDEADNFLAADGEKRKKEDEPFSRCTQLKSLMENTSRNFKVVFAGLHDVQRATRVANNPLAHFGSPLCIGPLMRNGEAREAQSLIETPLANLGFVFESQDLIYRILAQANYYPNLIQIYCLKLLQRMRERICKGALQGLPPYTITSKDLVDVYQGQQLRSDIKIKFQLTLDLDARFKLIAYLLAFYEIDFRDNGMPPQEIREWAIDSWPAGFREDPTSDNPRQISQESFVILLDEMVGLGILRKTEKGFYLLRSPNVVALLGNINEIAMVLEGAVLWEPPIKYTIESFRCHLDLKLPFRRSPLTASQEACLVRCGNEVILVAGSVATGLDDLGQAIQKLVGHQYFVDAKDVKTLNGFKEKLQALSSRKRAGKTVILVPSSVSWSASWVEEARRRVKTLIMQDAQVAIVFVLDPQQLWQEWDFWSATEAQQKLLLQPWSDDTLRLWLEDCGAGNSNKELRPILQQISGCWPLVLYRIAEIMIEQKQWAPNILLSETDNLFKKTDFKETLLQALGLIHPEIVAAIQVMADFNESLPIEEWEEWKNLMVPENRQDVGKIIAWGDALGIVNRRMDGWSIDPLVQRLLIS